MGGGETKSPPTEVSPAASQNGKEPPPTKKVTKKAIIRRSNRVLQTRKRRKPLNQLKKRRTSRSPKEGSPQGQSIKKKEGACASPLVDASKRHRTLRLSRHGTQIRRATALKSPGKGGAIQFLPHPHPERATRPPKERNATGLAEEKETSRFRREKLLRRRRKRTAGREKRTPRAPVYKRCLGKKASKCRLENSPRKGTGRQKEGAA